MEIGAADAKTPVIAQIEGIDKSQDVPFIIGRTRKSQDDLKVFNHPGTLEREFDPRNGSPLWKIYHPAGKLLFGIVSGRRWFYDSTHRGSELPATQHGKQLKKRWENGGNAWQKKSKLHNASPYAYAPNNLALTKVKHQIHPMIYITLQLGSSFLPQAWSTPCPSSQTVEEYCHLRDDPK